MPNPDELKKARSAAFRYLSYRDRSRSEIAGCLSQKGHSKSIVKKTLDHLTELGYIDDARFGIAWGRSRISSKKVGPRRLQQELLAKGLSRDMVDRTLAVLYAEVDEEELALQCAEKKIAGLKGVDAEVKRRRLIQFLQRKGFPGNIVYKTVEELIPFRASDQQPAPGIDK